MDDMRVALEEALSVRVRLPLLKAHVATPTIRPTTAMNATISLSSHLFISALQRGRIMAQFVLAVNIL
jgi:hypothetical protein